MANRHDVRSVSLEDIAVDIRTRLVYGIALQGFRRLAVLQIEAESVATVGRDVGIEVEDEIGLIDAERIAEDIVGAQIVNAAGGLIEVEFVVAVKCVVERNAAGQGSGKRRRRRIEIRRCGLDEVW